MKTLRLFMLVLLSYVLGTVGLQAQSMTTSTITCTSSNGSVSVFDKVIPSGTTATGKAFQMTIEGSGFTQHTRVFFSGQELSVIGSMTSATRIVAQVPANLNFSSTQSIQIVQRDGCALTKSFVIIDAATLPAPVINATSRVVYYLSTVSTVIISGSNFLPGAIVQLGGRRLEVTTSSSTQIIVIVPVNLDPSAQTLRVTNLDGQSTDFTIVNSIIVDNIVGVTDNNLFSQGQCYPNPFTNTLTFETMLDRSSAMALTLRNVMGARVLEEHHTAPSGRFGMTLDVRVLPSGVYMLEVRSTGKKWIYKVVKY